MRDPMFTSSLADVMVDFLSTKRALGYRYGSEADWLRVFDRYLITLHHRSCDLPKEVVQGWLCKRPHEAPATHQNRVTVVRELAMFMMRQSLIAYVPPKHMGPAGRTNFQPWIFTRDQVAALLAAASALRRDPFSPLRHFVMPELFRVLYGCGLRCGEALRLVVRDVELSDGVLAIRQGKFRQDRLVPVAPGLRERLQTYAAAMGPRAPDAVFFPGPHGRPYSTSAVYDLFRQLLRTVHVPHGGRGPGPRLHDLRATFAVHRIEAWCREGADLGVMLPILSRYMGHVGLAGTQRYLRLTPTLFPDLAERFEQAYGHLVPQLGDAA
jgi:integrase/recombinase XerD